nr:TetR/AcrR family transcriptional regulator [Sedimentibacter sp.]
MSKNEEKYGNKKNELVRIAEKLFVEKGYEETSVDDILKASGLSKGGFYHYFKSKDHVLEESINNLTDKLVRELELIAEDEKLNASDKMNLFMEKKSKFQASNRKYAKYLSMLMKSDFTLYKYYVTVAQKFVKPFGSIIEQGVKEGIYDVKHPYETADILLRAVTSLPQSTFYSLYNEDKTKHLNYSESIKSVIERTLGIKN